MSNQINPVQIVINEVRITIGLISREMMGMLPKLYATKGSVPICAARPRKIQLKIALGIRLHFCDNGTVEDRRRGWRAQRQKRVEN